MSALPEWVDTLAGFDRDGWYLPIVCTNRRHHAPEFLGLIYRDAGSGQVKWSGGLVHDESQPGVAVVHVWATGGSSADERAAVRDLHGRGSMHVRCPQGCTPRIPMATWDALCEAAPSTSAPWLDVSLGS